MFFKKNSENRKLIVGLGNPGTKYSLTRHNAGYMAIDHIIKETHAIKKGNKMGGDIYFTEIGGDKVILLKPTTFMNLSGDAVEKVMHYYKIPVSDLIVVSDDISLPVGKIRIRRGGSHGGHNGLRDISQKLSTNDFARIKIGVGGKTHPDMDLADWVLSRFKSDEVDSLGKEFPSVLKAAELIMNGKTDEAMNKFN